MIFVDTNVFVLALRYPRDPNAAENHRFLEIVRERALTPAEFIGELGA